MQFVCSIILIFVQILVTSGHSGYYWRDYTSTIPQDAVSGGKDVSEKPTYIGQTYLHNLGIFVTQITPGKSITIAAYGIKQPTVVQKILCSKYPEYFYWMATTAKTFHLDTTIAGKHAVIGGFDHVDANKGMLHVGRLTYQGGIKIGSVGGYLLENAQFSFIGGTAAEQKANSYEVLMFDNSKLETQIGLAIMEHIYFYAWIPLLFNILETSEGQNGYYWRDYTGLVPPDAFPAGKNIDGQETYIGQTYFHSHGIMVVQIVPEKEELDFALLGVRKTKTDIKILCTTDAGHFEWMTTSNKYFHLNTTNKHPVPGGYDIPNNGMLHIGRLTYQGTLKIGKIGSYLLENALFHFTHNTIELKANLYQVLMYQESVVDPQN